MSALGDMIRDYENRIDELEGTLQEILKLTVPLDFEEWEQDTISTVRKLVTKTIQKVE